jgi:formyltetrahydrofolate deformylase
MESTILLIDCKDEKGLIYKITSVISEHNLNIISNSEFVDRQGNRFFMRTEFAGSADRERLLLSLYKVLPEGVHIKLVPAQKKRIIVLATKEHHCLGELLIRHHYNELNAEILAVISNYENLEDLTSKFNIPYYHLTHQNHTRETHELELSKLIDQYKPEFLVLAKYMRVLSSDFVGRFPHRIINIHHSFLPSFAGANPYNQAYERGVKIIGATAHFVTADLDEGPIISQSVIPVDHSHSASEMAQAGRDVEKIVLAKSLKLVFDERVFVNGNKTIIFD